MLEMAGQHSLSPRYPLTTQAYSIADISQVFQNPIPNSFSEQSCIAERLVTFHASFITRAVQAITASPVRKVAEMDYEQQREGGRGAWRLEV
jgi:hypothetical protein